MLIGYARVSKGDEQSNKAQARALSEAGCKRVFEEKASGGRWDRPELHRMLDQLRDGDTVVVWKLDRLSRSLKDVLHLMDRITSAGAGFRSLTEAIDTTTAAGRMMMQMVGSFAEFERAMIRERTTTGLAQARAEGRIGGRRKKLDPKKRREIAESVLSGRKSGAEMARLYDISEPTVSRIVAEHRQNVETFHAPTSHDLKGLMKFLAREEWRECFGEVFYDHFGPVLDAGDMDFEDIAEILGDDWAMTLWGCAFEDFLTQDFEIEGGNVVDEYLKRRGWKENAQASKKLYEGAAHFRHEPLRSQ
ncbi:recombinase family protein [Sinorhizobium meliloti]|uniref:recombinase family protein n=1 Tax=Rhizobium meliloti TaxID=382 RepID=UPI003F742B19